jgi:hypothetical protein
MILAEIKRFGRHTCPRFLLVTKITSRNGALKLRENASTGDNIYPDLSLLSTGSQAKDKRHRFNAGYLWSEFTK